MNFFFLTMKPAFCLALMMPLFFIEPSFATSIRCVDKPDEKTDEFRARIQPSVPENYTEQPFVETAPKPQLTAEEQERGFLLFQRPITEQVYPNTHPLDYERLEGLSAFAAQEEFEPVTFSIYPTRKLENLKVRCSALKNGEAEISGDDIVVRLATCWNIGYPTYTSRHTYRRMPELLEQVTVNTSPAYECQRYWITVHAPKDAKPGIYTGTRDSSCSRIRPSTVRHTTMSRDTPSIPTNPRRISGSRWTTTTGRWSTMASMSFQPSI